MSLLTSRNALIFPRIASVLSSALAPSWPCGPHIHALSLIRPLLPCPLPSSSGGSTPDSNANLGCAPAPEPPSVAVCAVHHVLCAACVPYVSLSVGCRITVTSGSAFPGRPLPPHTPTGLSTSPHLTQASQTPHIPQHHMHLTWPQQSHHKHKPHALHLQTPQAPGCIKHPAPKAPHCKHLVVHSPWQQWLAWGGATMAGPWQWGIHIARAQAQLQEAPAMCPSAQAHVSRCRV